MLQKKNKFISFALIYLSPTWEPPKLSYRCPSDIWPHIVQYMELWVNWFIGSSDYLIYVLAILYLVTVMILLLLSTTHLALYSSSREFLTHKLTKNGTHQVAPILLNIRFQLWKDIDFLTLLTLEETPYIMQKVGFWIKIWTLSTCFCHNFIMLKISTKNKSNRFFTWVTIYLFYYIFGFFTSFQECFRVADNLS